MLVIPESQDSRQVLSHRGISLSWSNRDTAQRANSHVGYNSLGEMFRRVLPTQSSNFHANWCLWGKCNWPNNRTDGAPHSHSSGVWKHDLKEEIYLRVQCFSL